MKSRAAWLLTTIVTSVTMLSALQRPAGSQTAAAAATGTIKGHIVATGTLPGNPLIRMGMDPKCVAANGGKRVFQNAVTAKVDGSLADVFIKLDGTFPQTPIPTTAVVVDQRGCMYGPRVVG